MGKKGNGLAVFALIFGLIGAGTGGYLFVTDYLLVEEPEEAILPKARIYYDDSTLWVLHNTGKVIEFTDTSYDTHNAFNFTTSSYIIPESGYYQINAQLGIDAQAGEKFVIYILRINNSFYSYSLFITPETTNNFGVGISDMVYATAGDTIRIRCFYYGTSGQVRYISDGEHLSYFTIAKLA